MLYFELEIVILHICNNPSTIVQHKKLFCLESKGERWLVHEHKDLEPRA